MVYDLTNLKAKPRGSPARRFRHIPSPTMKQCLRIAVTDARSVEATVKPTPLLQDRTRLMQMMPNKNSMTQMNPRCGLNPTKSIHAASTKPTPNRVAAMGGCLSRLCLVAGSAAPRRLPMQSRWRRSMRCYPACTTWPLIVFVLSSTTMPVRWRATAGMQGELIEQKPP